MNSPEWRTPAETQKPDLPARVPRTWVGPGGSAPDPAPEHDFHSPEAKAWDKLLLIVGAAVGVAALLIVPGILNQGGQNPIAQAAEATMGSSGVRMTFSAEIKGPFEMTMRGDGVLDGEKKRAEVALDGSMSGPESQSFHMDEIVDDHDVYLRGSQSFGALGLPDKWIRISTDGFGDLGGGDASAGFFGGTSSTSPRELIDSLESESENVSVVGHETVGGQDTTHYTADIDVQKFIDQIRDRAGDTAADWFARLDPTETVDVWIDGGGLLRRMQVDMTFGPLMTMTADIGFSDYGIHPQIDVPPPSEVEDMSGALSQAQDALNS